MGRNAPNTSGHVVNGTVASVRRFSCGSFLLQRPAAQPLSSAVTGSHLLCRPRSPPSAALCWLVWRRAAPCGCARGLRAGPVNAPGRWTAGCSRELCGVQRAAQQHCAGGSWHRAAAFEQVRHRLTSLCRAGRVVFGQGSCSSQLHIKAASKQVVHDVRHAGQLRSCNEVPNLVHCPGLASRLLRSSGFLCDSSTARVPCLCWLLTSCINVRAEEQSCMHLIFSGQLDFGCAQQHVPDD